MSCPPSSYDIGRAQLVSRSCYPKGDSPLISQSTLMANPKPSPGCRAGKGPRSPNSNTMDMCWEQVQDRPQGTPLSYRGSSMTLLL